MYNFANIIILRFYSRSIPPSAIIACDLLLLLSLIASGCWLCLAATSSIDSTVALDIQFYTSFFDFSDPDTRRCIIEIIAISTTFITAYVTLSLWDFVSSCVSRRILHTPLAISAILNVRHLRPHPTPHHITSKDIERLPIHPALRASPSPLPYPNPNHPTCAYAASPIVHYLPPRAVRYNHQASPLGVHVKEGGSPPLYERYEDEGRGQGMAVLEDMGGLLKDEKRRIREKVIDF
ncbi:MAG: hypothetical protein Q9166_007695 [cf. Caloplaca sp. 2 TL-2023]